MKITNHLLAFALTIAAFSANAQINNARGVEMDLICTLQGSNIYRTDTLGKKPYNEIYRGDTIYGAQMERPRFYLHQSDEFKATLSPAQQQNYDPNLFGSDSFVEISDLTENEVNRVFDILLKKCDYIVTDEQKFETELSSNWGAGKYSLARFSKGFDWTYNTSKPYKYNSEEFIKQSKLRYKKLEEELKSRN